MRQTVDKVKVRSVQLYPFLNRKSSLSTRTKLMSNKTCLVPIITYASVVWEQTARANMAKLEVVQQKIIRKIVNTPWYVCNRQFIKDLMVEIRRRNKILMENIDRQPNMKLRTALDYDLSLPSKMKIPLLVALS